MFKKIIGFLILLLFAIELHSIEPKKYNLSVCAVFKNETPFLKEWLEYHLEVGVEHFYLYDNGSTDRYMDVLRPYIRKKVVTLIHWPDLLNETDEDHTFLWALSTQISAYENAARVRSTRETKWLIFIDVNEFLVPAGANKLSEVLEKYRDYPGITMPTDFFDASKTDALPPRKLVVETVELTAPELNPPKEVAKTIFKPDLCNGFCWPPYQCCFKDQQKAVPLKRDELRINRYVNRYKGYLHVGKLKERLAVDNRMLSEEEMAELLEEGYEIEDQDRSIFRFIPKLLRRLGYELFNW